MTAPADGPARRRAMARAGHSGEVDVALGGLGDTDPEVRAIALGALARLGSLTAAALSAALEDPAPGVRRRALELAATRPEIDLLGALGDPDPIVLEVAAFAAGEQEKDEPAVIARLASLATGHADALVREAAVAALGAIGAPAGLPAILAAIGDKATVRRRAVIALAPFEGDEVDAALERAKGDRDWQVRQAAEDLTS
jgi:HEAT repeat protein